uniref:hypothetical protein n=1 Tax=Gemmiger formicilis TaxID=745368 RepID=UPI0040266C1D
ERILGKDEVSSSNLDSSSKGKHLEVLGLRGVFFFTGAAVCCILLVVHSVQFLRKLSSGPSIDVPFSLLYN